MHTPGPWTWTFEPSAEKNRRLHPVVRGAQTQFGTHPVIAYVGTLAEDSEQEAADAQLITAAPDLLDAAYRVLARAGIDAYVVNTLKAAVLKAEGSDAR